MIQPLSCRSRSIKVNTRCVLSGCPVQGHTTETQLNKRPSVLYIRKHNHTHAFLNLACGQGWNWMAAQGNYCHQGNCPWQAVWVRIAVCAPSLYVRHMFVYAFIFVSVQHKIQHLHSNKDEE